MELIDDITDYTAIFVPVYPWEKLYCFLTVCCTFAIVNPPHNHTLNTSNTDQIYLRLRKSFLTSEFRQCIPARIVSSAMESPVSCNHDSFPKSHNSLTCQGSIILQQPKLKKKAKAKHLHKDFLCLILCTIFPNHKPRYSHFRNFLSRVPRITKTFGNQIAWTKTRQLTFPASDFKCFCNNFIWTPVSTKPTKRWLLLI